MEQKDNGDWLSAQQAVRADGTELTNLPLINKKLPPLSGSLMPSTAVPDANEAAKKGCWHNTKPLNQANQSASPTPSEKPTTLSLP